MFIRRKKPNPVISIANFFHIAKKRIANSSILRYNVSFFQTVNRESLVCIHTKIVDIGTNAQNLVAFIITHQEICCKSIKCAHQLLRLLSKKLQKT
jgi:hypothetical protein